MQNADFDTLQSAYNYATSLVFQADDNTGEYGYLNVTPYEASLTVTNSIGNSHGIVVDTSKTVISGGTTSTSLTLDDAGATLATVETGGPAQLHGVADGTANNDAVNVGQLNNALAGVGSNPAEIKRLDGRVDKLSDKLDKIAKRAYGGTALAVAMAGAAPDPYHDASFSVGTAMFNGEGAIAVNLNLKDAKTNAVIGLGIGVTTAGDVGVKATATWQWNPTINNDKDIK